MSSSSPSLESTDSSSNTVTPTTLVPTSTPTTRPPSAVALPRTRSSNGISERKLRFTALEEGKKRRKHVKGAEEDGDEWIGDGWHGLRSDPGTPNISETAAQIRRTLSLASLSQLNSTLSTLSADPSTRLELLTTVTSSTKSLVWRGPREPRKLPSDAERALVLALRRAVRSGLLAWAVRSGVGLVLALVGAVRRRQLKWSLIRHAIFGAEPFRFAAMIGTFTFLNTLTLHLLRLSPPYSYILRRLRHFATSLHSSSPTSAPTFGPPVRYPYDVSSEDEVDGYDLFEEEDTGERRWQAAVAGAVGSLGLLWEPKARRVGVAQQ